MTPHPPRPPRARLVVTTTQTPHAWCGCGVAAYGEAAMAAMRRHLLDSATCTTIFAVQILKVAKAHDVAD